jgi:hypothetical protein
MSTKINVAGVWKSPTPKINVAGTWKAPSIKINVAGTWKSVYSPLAVNIAVNGRFNTRLNNTCYAGAYFTSSNFQYEYTATAGGSSLGNYVTTGSTSDVWLQWTRTGGTLSDWNSLDAGDGRVNAGTSRYWRLYRSSIGVNTIIGYWKAYDAASGGTLLDTGASGTYSATYEFESCPTCCFVTGTMVTMGSGLEMPIERVREGDSIMVKCPVDGVLKSEAVQEIVVRERVPIFELIFEDGSTLKTSPDHPIHVKGKGYSSVHPFEYKDLGIPEQLSVGDRVTHISGPSREIKYIRFLETAPIVYTFTNMYWFANGNLVA